MFWTRICSGGVKLGVLSLALVAAAGCSFPGPWSKRDRGGEESRKPPEVIIPVEANSPSRGEISSYYETTTRVEAERESDIASESVGVCVGVYVEEGDYVKAGQRLAELDTDEAEVAVSQAKVEVRQRKLELERATWSLNAGLISQSEYETAQFTFEQSEERLKTQRVQLANLTLRAPFDGLITVRSVKHGSLVSSGTPAFHIVDPSSYMLIIAPPEKEVSRLHPGQTAQVAIDALPGEQFEAKVRRINPGIDAATGTIKVILDFDEASRSRLRASAFARVRLAMDTHTDSLLVPKESVIEENARTFVYVVREIEEEERSGGNDEASKDLPAGKNADEEVSSSGKEVLASENEKSPKEDAAEEVRARWTAERVEVEVGFEDTYFVEITTEFDSLTETDLIVTRGQHTLKPGSKVAVTNLEAAILEKKGLTAEEALKAAKEKREKKNTQGRRRGGRG